jgi:hypothetical protein
MASQSAGHCAICSLATTEICSWDIHSGIVVARISRVSPRPWINLPETWGTLLVEELAAWFPAIGARGVILHVFTGVTKDGRQAYVILTGLPLDHIQRRDFLIWLCRTEQFTTYAYGTHVGVADDDGSSVGEGIAIHASSEWYDVSKTLGIDRTADGNYVLFDDHYAVLPAQAENGIFLGLQRSTANLPEDSEGLFRKLWDRGSSDVLWRQRTDLPPPH